MQQSPLIGISSSLEQAQEGPWVRRAALLPETYLLGVEEAGGIPLVLPPQPPTDEAAERVLSTVEGLVLSGGADVDPGQYGQERDPRTQPPRHDRDAWERALLLGAAERDLPVLAICRGIQLMNAALGGTLVQHLPDRTASDHGREAGSYSPVDVRIVDGTLVRDVLGAVGDRLTVHCHHHQALDRVAPGLVVAAESDDGTVEAVESVDHRFLLGVQWHPEQDAADRRLFRALVAAAVAEPVRAG